MAEIKGKVLATGKEVAFEDVEPLESAELYKKVSDKIWEQNTSDTLTVVWLPIVVPVEESLLRINEFAGSVSEGLVVAGEGKEIQLTGPWGDKAELKPENPTGASVGTYWWDYQHTGRRTKIGRKREYVEFTDGHQDYARELFAALYFDTNPGTLAVRYLVQRYQYAQDQPTELHVNAWFSGFAETGYEGNSVGHSKLTPEQETRFVSLVQELGGLSIEQ